MGRRLCFWPDILCSACQVKDKRFWMTEWMWAWKSEGKSSGLINSSWLFEIDAMKRLLANSSLDSFIHHQNFSSSVSLRDPSEAKVMCWQLYTRSPPRRHLQYAQKHSDHVLTNTSTHSHTAFLKDALPFLDLGHYIYSQIYSCNNPHYPQSMVVGQRCSLEPGFCFSGLWRLVFLSEWIQHNW